MTIHVDFRQAFKNLDDTLEPVTGPDGDRIPIVMKYGGSGDFSYYDNGVEKKGPGSGDVMNIGSWFDV